MLEKVVISRSRFFGVQITEFPASCRKAINLLSLSKTQRKKERKNLFRTQFQTECKTSSDTWISIFTLFL